MAVATGTATNYTDLLARLITFLTTDATLVGLGQNWTVLSTTTVVTGENDHLLRGPGLSASDQIHVRVYASSAAASDRYGMGAQAFVSHNSSLAHGGQPGISEFVGMALWNNSIPYWFIANGRRFIVIAKVSTTYTSMYAGFYLPYATPTEFPYPVVVMGSHEDATTHRYSQADHNVGGFFDPSDGNAFIRHNDGTWLSLANYYEGSGRANLTTTNVWPYNVDLVLEQNADGSYSLLPTVIHSSYSSGNVYGELDGVFFTSAAGMASEDTVTIDADTYLIVQSVYRTDRRAFAAIKLV
jgi:hypothetical protein